MSVLVVLSRQEEVIPLLNWGEVFAKAKELPLVIQILEEAEQMHEPVECSLEEECKSELMEVVVRQAKLLDDTPSLQWWRTSKLSSAVLKASRDSKAQLVVVGQSANDKKESQGLQQLGANLMNNLLCDLMMLRADLGSGLQCKKILLPTAGGPHANAALSLMADVVKHSEGEVTAMTVVEEADEFGEGLGERKLKRVFKEAGVAKSERIKPLIARADKPTDAIREQAEEGYDLIVLGSSQQGAIRKTLFGTIPERMLKGPSKTAIAIFRAAPALLEKTEAQVSALLRRVIPQLDRQSRIELSDHLHQGSKAGLDFIALIMFSTAIASLGLLQNSVAVIIGAMLVAPLMTPMLGAGLGLVQGNILLVREAIRSIILGFLLSLLVGFLVGSLSEQTLTPEMMGRGTPNLLDLGIALISGAAASYALARPGLLEALPGVAISAALVPPIATSGISLAIGETRNAIGSALLFGTNLVAIILATALVLFVLGVRARRDTSQPRLWARRGTIGLLLLALVLCFPLSTTLLSKVTPREQALKVQLGKLLKNEGMSLLSILRVNHGGKREVHIRISSPKPVPSSITFKILRLTRPRLKKKTTIRILTTLEVRATY